MSLVAAVLGGLGETIVVQVKPFKEADMLFFGLPGQVLLERSVGLGDVQCWCHNVLGARRHFSHLDVRQLQHHLWLQLRDTFFKGR